MYLQFGKINQRRINNDKLTEALSSDSTNGISVDRLMDNFDYSKILNNEDAMRSEDYWYQYMDEIDSNYQHTNCREPDWVTSYEFNPNKGMPYRQISTNLWEEFLQVMGNDFNNSIKDRRNEQDTRWNKMEVCLLDTKSVKKSVTDLGNKIDKIDESNYQLIDLVKWITFWTTQSIARDGKLSVVKVDEQN